jgi:hypothetical protein
MSANLGEKRAGDRGSTLDEGTRRSLGVLAGSVATLGMKAAGSDNRMN